MNTTIPDCWPDIKVDVLPPLAILKAQEGLLARRMQGMLEAKVTTIEAGNLVQHQLDLIAPSLNFYRERLLTATHDRLRLYPVTVAAECFAEKSEVSQGPRPLSPLQAALAPLQAAVKAFSETHIALVPEVVQRQASTDEEFVQLVRKVLQSAEVRALMASLIARINQANGEHHGNGTVEQEGRSDAAHGEN
ncbi:MAG TPA: hypothetical protein VE999_19150 [Gemmataceae bacterium]|nr:hypothetical protein [Gemmataceae bacterium]